MPFERIWGDTCPKVWDRFMQNGRAYVIQDIPPEEDEQAIEILVEHLCMDEILCKLSGLIEDPESVASVKAFWAECLSQRMSLGCYTEVEGKNTLIAIKVCVVDSVKERFPSCPIYGTAWKNVYYAMDFVEAKCDTFQHFNVDALLHGYGVVVTRQFRGAKLGAKLFFARRSLALAHGLKATSAVFTGPASQSLGARCGFVSIQEATLTEIAEAGYDYPKINHVIKLMAQKYSEN